MQSPPELTLPSGWTMLHRFVDEVNVLGVSIRLCGLVAEKEGHQLSGSAGSVDEDPGPRAYGELFERIAVREAISTSLTPLSVYDTNHNCLSSFDKNGLEGENQTGVFQFSLSNGVGLASSWTEACRSARLELLERDAVLRAWFNQSGGIALNLEKLRWLPVLSGQYEIHLKEFLSEIGGESVTGCFALPMNPTLPLVYGLAAAGSQALSIQKAERECLQRLGFLWGEEIPSSLPPFAPSAHFHQEFYLYPENHALIRNWLNTPPLPERRLPLGDPEPRVAYLDLTLKERGIPFHVAKALDPSKLPLVFGKYPERILQGFGLERCWETIHPIA